MICYQSLLLSTIVLNDKLKSIVEMQRCCTQYLNHQTHRQCLFLSVHLQQWDHCYCLHLKQVQQMQWNIQ